jgi:hypothetical protein
MIEEPVPTMPEMVPATRPTMRTKRKPTRIVSLRGGYFSTIHAGA